MRIWLLLLTLGILALSSGCQKGLNLDFDSSSSQSVTENDPTDSHFVDARLPLSADPNAVVGRAQAAFLVTSYFSISVVPPFLVDDFKDIGGVFADYVGPVKALRSNGLSVGCAAVSGGRNFCPNTDIPLWQFLVFVVRGMHPSYRVDPNNTTASPSDEVKAAADHFTTASTAYSDIKSHFGDSLTLYAVLDFAIKNTLMVASCDYACLNKTLRRGADVNPAVDTAVYILNKAANPSPSSCVLTVDTATAGSGSSPATASVSGVAGHGDTHLTFRRAPGAKGDLYWSTSGPSGMSIQPSLGEAPSSSTLPYDGVAPGVYTITAQIGSGTTGPSCTFNGGAPSLKLTVNGSQPLFTITHWALGSYSTDPYNHPMNNYIDFQGTNLKTLTQDDILKQTFSGTGCDNSRFLMNPILSDDGTKMRDNFGAFAQWGFGERTCTVTFKRSSDGATASCTMRNMQFGQGAPYPCE